MRLYDQIESAISAHGLWKGRLRAAIQSGTSDLTVMAVRADDQCTFGKWLHKLNAEGRKSPSYSTCRELHAQFHKEAADVLALALAGKRQEAANAIGPSSVFSKTSANLTRAMVAWAEAAKAKVG